VTLAAEFHLDVGGFSLDAQLTLEDGVLVLFGPSGAGKSLTVAALAGLVRPRSGSIRLGDRLLFDAAAGIDVATHLRRVGYVPQHHSLFPFLSVRDNVAFGLPRARRRTDPGVDRLIGELGLTDLADARPASLSGGERQRVALARALAVEPSLLLLDEPFASIDQAGRRALRAVLADALRAHGIPAVLVTHDADEAVELGTRAVIYERGRTVRSGAPRDVIGGRRYTLRGTLRPDGTLEGARLEGDLDGLPEDVELTFC